MFGGAVNHCQAHFFRRSGNQLDRIFTLGCLCQVVGEVDFHNLIAFVEAQYRAFVQSVRLAFVYRNGLELAGNPRTFKYGNDFCLNRTGRLMRYHVELVGVFRHFQQIVSLLYFRDGGFYHQWLYRMGAQRSNRRMGAGVVFVVFQLFRRLFGALFESGIGIGQGAYDAAECDFLSEEFTRIRIGDIFIDTVGQVAARFLQPFSVNTISFGIQHPAVGSGDQSGRGGCLLVGNDLRMLHEDAVEVDIDSGNTVSGYFFIRTHFDNRDVVCLFQAEARFAVNVAQHQNLTRINQVGIVDLAAVCTPQAAPLPRAVQVFAGDAPQGVALFDRVPLRRIRTHLQICRQSLCREYHACHAEQGYNTMLHNRSPYN